MSLMHNVALVSGASRGIGKAIALQLGAEGAFIVGTATTAEGAERITEYLKEAGVAGQGVILNVADETSITSVMSQLAKDEKMPSVLVNNAGITADNLFLRMGIAQWSKVIDTNLTGVYRLIHACIRPMIKARFGRIVNITSVVGMTGNPGQANYAAAKAGIMGLSKSLARELGSRGITVNSVAPGFIDTDMTRTLTPEQQAKLLEQVPLARVGTVEEVAHAVSFLVSKGAGYITGETLHVNGGMYMG
jgi:3-oxoacyl-[acyl-carrier protein] reductase